MCTVHGMLVKKIKPTHAMNVKDGSICRVRLGSVRPRVLRASCCAVRQKQWI
ncbi:hypothetical protein DPMN_051160 [Dreissena polymorpha]|uniref:Uncharacterized protein n=1 Tax=Dreissena polymorpha TaxID=45954 RepID=A0A9D4HMX7_DREPO|nr:hypothetical protein DPMN_051049 [Dreissena polymorpha]KAH3725326.1 hypothetical protein DPMN_051160 [Dreissena polymorpha]